MPVALALAETLDLSAADLRAAIVAGYEVGLRVGALLGKAHYAVCHVTATAGCFAAAAAASRALGLAAEATLHAFGHAGTQAGAVAVPRRRGGIRRRFSRTPRTQRPGTPRFWRYRDPRGDTVLEVPRGC
jgi:2-methylcitrate dehydratase PrpD